MYTREWILKGNLEISSFRINDFSSYQKSSCIHVRGILKGKPINIYFSCNRFFLMSKILMYTREWNFKRKNQKYWIEWTNFPHEKILMYTRDLNFKMKTQKYLVFRVNEFSSCQKSSCIHVSGILKGNPRNIWYFEWTNFLMSKILMYTREWNFKRKPQKYLVFKWTNFPHVKNPHV